MPSSKALRVSLDRKNTFVRGEPFQEDALDHHIKKGGVTLQKILCQLTDRVISAMRTKRAGSAFQEIAETWSRQHGPVFNPADAANDFQRLLGECSNDQSCWPTIVVALAMHPNIAGAHTRQSSINRIKSDFELDNQYISLNGVRLDLLRYDYEEENPEMHVRWLQIFCVYCHEVAHMFVTYLSKKFTEDVECNTPDDYRATWTAPGLEGGEAGDRFEDNFFGGFLRRKGDVSGRNPIYMTGIPILRNSKLDYDIPLDRIMNITTKKTHYVDADFDLQPYLPEEPGEGEQPNLHRIHKKWFVGYLARFGRHFTPLQLYPQDKVDLKDRLADIVIDDSSYIPICLQTQGTPRLLLPQCCTYSKYGSHIGIPSTKVARSLKEHSGRSGAAQLAACKAASFKPVHHEQRKTPQAASTRKNQVQPTGQHRDEKFEDSRQPNKGHAEDKPIGQKFPLVKFPHPKQSSHQTGNPPQRKGQELASRPSTHHCSHKARSAYTNSSRLGQELPANDKTRSACTNSNPRHQKLNCPSAYTKMTHFFKNSQQTKRRPAPLPAKTTTIHSAKNSRL